MATPEHESYWQYLNRPITETFGRPIRRRAPAQDFLIWFLAFIVVGLIVLAIELTH